MDSKIIPAVYVAGEMEAQLDQATQSVSSGTRPMV